MSEFLTQDDDKPEILSGFAKVKEKCETDGYADGLSDGRDSVFQEAFDHGYQDAFTLAFKLGVSKGKLCAAGETDLPVHLQKISVANCQTCANPELIKQNVKEQRAAQVAENEKFLNNLPEVSVPSVKVLERVGLSTSVSSETNIKTVPRDYLKEGKSDW